MRRYRYMRGYLTTVLCTVLNVWFTPSDSGKAAKSCFNSRCRAVNMSLYYVLIFFQRESNRVDPQFVVSLSKWRLFAPTLWEQPTGSSSSSSQRQLPPVTPVCWRDGQPVSPSSSRGEKTSRVTYPQVFRGLPPAGLILFRRLMLVSLMKPNNCGSRISLFEWKVKLTGQKSSAASGLCTEITTSIN